MQFSLWYWSKSFAVFTWSSIRHIVKLDCTYSWIVFEVCRINIIDQLNCKFQKKNRVIVFSVASMSRISNISRAVLQLETEQRRKLIEHVNPQALLDKLIWSYKVASIVLIRICSLCSQQLFMFVPRQQIVKRTKGAGKAERTSRIVALPQL